MAQVFFLINARCWVGLWFVSLRGTCPELCLFSGKNSQVCSQPEKESAGPAKMPHEFPDLPGRQPRIQEDVPFFWMRSMCSLHCSGNHPLTGPHGGIHPTGLELAKPHLDRRGTELVAQFTKHNTNIIIIHRTSPSEHSPSVGELL